MWSTLFGKKPRKKPEPVRRTPRAQTVADAFGPPLTAEELSVNRTVLEQTLNQKMVCPAGKNQVFQRSLITKGGTTPPRIALRCQLRRDVGLPAEVYYEHIRDVCCNEPTRCEAYCKFKDRFVQT